MTLPHEQLKTEIDADPFLTVAEIAEMTRLSKQTVYRAVQCRGLEASRLRRSIRVRTSVVRSWIRAGCPDYGEAHL